MPQERGDKGAGNRADRGADKGGPRDRGTGERPEREIPDKAKSDRKGDTQKHPPDPIQWPDDKKEPRRI
jgi:hypothetical protein